MKLKGELPKWIRRREYIYFPAFAIIRAAVLGIAKQEAAVDEWWAPSAATFIPSGTYYWQTSWERVLLQLAKPPTAPNCFTIGFAPLNPGIEFQRKTFPMQIFTPFVWYNFTRCHFSLLFRLSKVRDQKRALPIEFQNYDNHYMFISYRMQIY